MPDTSHATGRDSRPRRTDLAAIDPTLAPTDGATLDGPGISRRSIAERLAALGCPDVVGRSFLHRLPGGSLVELQVRVLVTRALDRYLDEGWNVVRFGPVAVLVRLTA